MASTLMQPGTAELYDRIVALFGTRDVHPKHQTRIREAFGPGVTFDRLPPDVQQIILANEAMPQTTGWEDPMDVPEWHWEGKEPPDMDQVPAWVLDGEDPA